MLLIKYAVTHMIQYFLCWLWLWSRYWRLVREYYYWESVEINLELDRWRFSFWKVPIKLNNKVSGNSLKHEPLYQALWAVLFTSYLIELTALLKMWDGWIGLGNLSFRYIKAMKEYIVKVLNSKKRHLIVRGKSRNGNYFT